jgi:hypothetical protein
LGAAAHRISAHRALVLNPDVAKISERKALAGLRTGYAEQDNFHNRQGHRWQGRGAIALLSDFDYLVQALFAEQANTSLNTHRKNRAGSLVVAGPTKLERLVEVCQAVAEAHVHIMFRDVCLIPKRRDRVALIV